MQSVLVQSEGVPLTALREHWKLTVMQLHYIFCLEEILVRFTSSKSSLLFQAMLWLTYFTTVAEGLGRRNCLQLSVDLFSDSKIKTCFSSACTNPIRLSPTVDSHVGRTIRAYVDILLGYKRMCAQLFQAVAMYVKVTERIELNTRTFWLATQISPSHIANPRSEMQIKQIIQFRSGVPRLEELTLFAAEEMTFFHSKKMVGLHWPRPVVTATAVLFNCRLGLSGGVLTRARSVSSVWLRRSRSSHATPANHVRRDGCWAWVDQLVSDGTAANKSPTKANCRHLAHWFSTSHEDLYTIGPLLYYYSNNCFRSL